MVKLYLIGPIIAHINRVLEERALSLVEMWRLQTWFAESLFHRVVAREWILLWLDYPCSIKFVFDVDKHAMRVVTLLDVLLHHVVNMVVLLSTRSDTLLQHFGSFCLPKPLLLVIFWLWALVYPVISHRCVILVLISHERVMWHQIILVLIV